MSLTKGQKKQQRRLDVQCRLVAAADAAGEAADLMEEAGDHEGADAVYALSDELLHLHDCLGREVM